MMIVLDSGESGGVYIFYTASGDFVVIGKYRTSSVTLPNG